MTPALAPHTPDEVAHMHLEYVLPGDVRSAASPTRFVTILGSCVAICLYDPVRGIGGINHFLLPGPPPVSETEPTRWATASTEELFRQVFALGANPRFLQAKVFGGSQLSIRPVPDEFCIGARNVTQALDALAARHVEVKNQSTGGKTGCKIIFESNTGRVWVKQLMRGGP